MNLSSMGNLLEGKLRMREGEWVLELPDTSTTPLDDILKLYKDKDIRITIVGLKELDQLAQMLQNTGSLPE